MAAPVDRTRDLHTHAARDNVALLQEFNKLVLAFRGVCAKLDLDAGVTDVNYFLLWADVASATGGPAKVTP